MNIKTFVKQIIAPILWLVINKTKKTNIMEFKTPFNLKIGKNVMIRRGSYVGSSVEIGDYSYISGPNSFIDSTKIGKYCSIARSCTIGAASHNYNWLTTSPIITDKKYLFVYEDKEVPQKDFVIIGNDVWIGMNSTINMGVIIGNGAVIASGSVVVKNVEPYSIVGGNPARHIKYRFSKEIIERLLDIEWWNWNEKEIRDKVDLFYDVEGFVTNFSIKRMI